VGYWAVGTWRVVADKDGLGVIRKAKVTKNSSILKGLFILGPRLGMGGFFRLKAKDRGVGSSLLLG